MGREKLPRPVVKCIHCGYTCRGKQALGRHITLEHPDIRRNPKIAIRLDTLQGVMELAANALSRRQSRHTVALADAISEQEVKLRIALSAVALDKALRLAQLGPLLRRLDTTLDRKLDPRMLEALGPLVVAELQKHVAASLSEEAKFLQSILSMKADGSSELFKQLIDTLRSAAGTTTRILATRERLEASLEIPSSAVEREALRWLLKHVVDRSDTEGSDARSRSPGLPAEDDAAGSEVSERDSDTA